MCMYIVRLNVMRIVVELSVDLSRSLEQGVLQNEVLQCEVSHSERVTEEARKIRPRLLG